MFRFIITNWCGTGVPYMGELMSAQEIADDVAEMPLAEYDFILYDGSN